MFDKKNCSLGPKQTPCQLEGPLKSPYFDALIRAAPVFTSADSVRGQPTDTGR